MDSPIAAQIVSLAHSEGLEADAHLRAQWLADRLRVSRSPVNEALGVLHEKGLLRREPNRGYFLRKPVTDLPKALRKLKLAQDDPLTGLRRK